MITKKSKIWQYFSHVFVAVDQLGNALAGGNSDNTISARVGYYNHHYREYLVKGKVPWYWKYFRDIIDKTFEPVDGKNHCHEAYHNDPGEIFDNTATNFMIALAAIIIIISCIVIALILYLLSALRIVKQKTIERDVNLEKRLSSCTCILDSTLDEIKEHGVNFCLEGARKELENLISKTNKIQERIKKE